MKTNSAEPTEARVLEILDEYMAGLQAGRAPDREALLARHPELAQSLAASFRALDFVHDAGHRLEASETPRGPEEPSSAGRVLGDYRIVREIARGGMAVVYEAEQVSLGRRVALKVLPFAAVLDPKQLQRFKNEAQAAAQLQHPHIVPVHAVGCERGVHYYAMQYVEGQSLAVAIRDMKGEGGAGSSDDSTGARTPISSHGSNRESSYIRMAAKLGVQAAQALDHAHQLGIVHRDVKPGNLLVDLAGTLWITDFGLAHTLKDVGLTMTGELLGTFRYMSPEQALAKRVPVDHRTDVYSLGATLYELLTLEPAFPGDDPHLLIQDIASKEPASPRRLNASLPRDLETVLLKAMAKDPGRRYATAGAMAEDLERFLENRPIEARRPGPVRRVVKWGRRHRVLVGTAVGVLLLAVAGLATGAALLWREKEQTRTAYERAEANLSLALTALDRVYMEEAEGHPRIREGLPRDLLEKGLEFYEQFARANAHNKRAAMFMGSAHQRASLIFRELGQDDLAAEALERAVSTCREVARLEPDNAAAQLVLGDALYDKGDFGAAATSYRDAIHADPNYVEAHNNLGNALFYQGAHDAAIASYHRALRIRPDYAESNHNLGNVHAARHDGDAAIASYRKATASRPDLWKAHVDLGNALLAKGETDEAIACYRKVIGSRPHLWRVHNNLGGALHQKGDYKGAIASCEEAIRLQPKAASAHYGLACVLAATGTLDRAIHEYKVTIQLDQSLAEAHCNLGHALTAQGNFQQALPCLRTGHELGSKRPAWPYPSEDWLEAGERRADLEGRLDRVLSGQLQPRDAAERVEFAEVLYAKSRHAEAARMYAGAFDEDAALAEDLDKGDRYDAACSAALAAARGEADAADWRRRALEWLRADLAAREKAPSGLVATLEHWRRDSDLAAVRDRPDDIPETERGDWRELWTAVDRALESARLTPR